MQKLFVCFEGEPIQADGERIIITEEESDDGLGLVTTLRIVKAKDEDNGKYTLLVKKNMRFLKIINLSTQVVMTGQYRRL